MRFFGLFIVVLNHNGKEFTLRCIESLRPVLEDGARCIVVDNGSTDGSVEALTALDVPSVEILTLAVNRGVAAGRNAAIGRRRSSDRYLLLLDNDTEANPGAIIALMRYMDGNPRCGIAAPCLIAPTGEVQQSFKSFPGIMEKLRGLFRRRQIVERVAGVLHPFYVIGACQMLRCSMIDEIGLLDEGVFFGPEDADYCMRAREGGYDVSYLGHLAIVHHWQRSSRKNLFSPTARRHILGLIHFYIKHRRI